MDSDAGSRLYFSIGEICEITGLEAHVLRFWESEFPELKPRKSDGGTRRYRREDLDLIRRIHKLVHVEKFTLEGARRQLKRKPAKQGHLIGELKAILRLLD